MPVMEDAGRAMKCDARLSWKFCVTPSPPRLSFCQSLFLHNGLQYLARPKKQRSHSAFSFRVFRVECGAHQVGQCSRYKRSWMETELTKKLTFSCLVSCARTSYAQRRAGSPSAHYYIGVCPEIGVPGQVNNSVSRGHLIWITSS